jgi:hypothetical protein
LESETGFYLRDREIPARVILEKTRRSLEVVPSKRFNNKWVEEHDKAAQNNIYYLDAKERCPMN